MASCSAGNEWQKGGGRLPENGVGVAKTDYLLEKSNTVLREISEFMMHSIKMR